MLSLLVLSVTCLLSVQGAELWSWSHETSKTDIRTVLQNKFEYQNTQGQFGIGDSLTLAEDPSQPGQYIFKVVYDKGSYSGTKDLKRGAQFYASPSAVVKQTHLTLTLEYELYFENTFGWNKGGKLPGLWGGARTCSGGRLSDDCFSTRLMWRRNGDGEVYTYATRNQSPTWDEWCAKYDSSSIDPYKFIHCTKSTGIEMGKGSFTFQRRRWHRIRQEVQLNQIPSQKGYVKLWIDDNAEVYITDVVMRDNTIFGIDGLFFSTFYGGGDSSWACPKETATYYRNFRISTDTMTPSIAELVG